MSIFTSKDLALLDEKGITKEQAIKQLERFKEGFPFLKIVDSATVNNGIEQWTEQEQKNYITAWETYCQQEHDIVKFVPASGAASRMFKNLFAFLNADYTTPQTDFEKTFFDEITHFAFYKELTIACTQITTYDIPTLMGKGLYKEVVACLLNENGLNYGKLPKGLLTFHQYGEETRTPVEEHLSEGALYTKNKKGEVHLHFTVSGEHQALFEQLIAKKKTAFETENKTRFLISFSQQKPKTDTLAATPENEPFRNVDGSLLFRPGGHGALIENLNDLDADIIFIKNIDNIVPDYYKKETVTYKKLLAGILVSLQKQIFDYAKLLNSGQYTQEQLLEVVHFLRKKLYTKLPEIKYLEDSELAIYLTKKLNRPIRVCGMVRNEGEPGGGPFFAYNPDGSFSLQILESSQIDLSKAENKEILENSSYFNPVDLVCGIKNFQNKPYDLTNYVDANTGFISQKSKDGKEVQALELPGLWNGAMSNWNTVFVEVASSTFNPVKTVNDLLRPTHQPEK